MGKVRVVIACLVVLLSGCVTTQSSIKAQKLRAAKKKALIDYMDVEEAYDKFFTHDRKNNIRMKELLYHKMVWVYYKHRKYLGRRNKNTLNYMMGSLARTSAKFYASPPRIVVGGTRFFELQMKFSRMKDLASSLPWFRASLYYFRECFYKRKGLYARRCRDKYADFSITYRKVLREYKKLMIECRKISFFTKQKKCKEIDTWALRPPT